jgi:hypothetical protein
VGSGDSNPLSALFRTTRSVVLVIPASTAFSCSAPRPQRGGAGSGPDTPSRLGLREGANGGKGAQLSKIDLRRATPEAQLRGTCEAHSWRIRSNF